MKRIVEIALRRAPAVCSNTGRFGWIFAALVILCLGAIWSLCAADLYGSYRDERAAAATSADNVAGLLHDNILRNIQVYDFSLKALAEKLSDPNFKKAMLDAGHTSVFDDFAGIYRHGFLYVLDKDGIAIAASRPVPPALNLATRDYFKAHQPAPDKLGLYISRPFQSRMDNGKWTIAFSRRVSDANGALAGVVVGAVELDFFAELFRSVSLPPDSAITLFHRDGTMVLRESDRDKSVMVESAGAQIYKQLSSAPSGTFIEDSADGASRQLVAYRSIGNSPLYLEVGLSTRRMFERWRQKALVMFGGFLLLTGLVVMLAMVLGRELNRRYRAEETLAMLAATDGLTNLFNRRRFDEMLDIEWKRAIRIGHPLSILMIDVDFFKAFNDTYGHIDGDTALALIANTLRTCHRRPADLIARFGGEEFVALLPDTDQAGAMIVAETMREAVRNIGLSHAGSPYRRLTISVGVAALGNDRSTTTASDLLRLADQALYRAKAMGRNNVTSAGPDTLLRWSKAG